MPHGRKRKARIQELMAEFGINYCRAAKLLVFKEYQDGIGNTNQQASVGDSHTQAKQAPQSECRH